MSFSLRQAAKKIASRVASGSQHQQQRMAGNLPAKSNKFLEDMATRRENIEREFKWDARTLTNIAIFAGALPYVIYSFASKEFDSADAAAGRPKRPMWGSP